MSTERQFDDHAEGTIPNTEEVRHRWMQQWRGYTYIQGEEAFDAWLEQERAEVRREGHLEGYNTARQDMVSGAFIGGPTYETMKNSSTGLAIAAEAWDAGFQSGAYWGDPNPPTHRDERPPFDNPYRQKEETNGE